jgi:hypothetical protein
MNGGSAATGTEKTRTAALPLIMVAIVAGGLPLLWANRALLPTPDTWKANTADSPKPTRVVPPTIPIPTAPALPAQTPQMAPADSATTPPVTAATPGAAGSSSSSTSPTSTDSKTATGKNQPAKKSSTPKNKVRKAPAAETTEQPRPCTEATAALGLCELKRAVK